jgi:hypothetical protein
VVNEEFWKTEYADVVVRLKDLVSTLAPFIPKLKKSVRGTPKGCVIVIEVAEFTVTLQPPTPLMLTPDGLYKAVIELTPPPFILTTNL